MQPSCRFRFAKAKVAWAESQLEIVAREIDGIIEAHDKAAVEKMRPNEHGVTPLLYEVVDTPDLLAVHIGRIVGALKSALDTAAVEAVLEVEPEYNTKVVVFPFSGNDETTNGDKWVIGKVGPMKDAHRRVIVEARPYPGGNDVLLAMKELRDADEHRAIRVAPTIKAVGVVTFGSNRRSELIQKPDGGYDVAFVVTRHEPKISATVTVEFSEPRSVGQEVLGWTRTMIAETTKIISAFDSV